MIFVCFRCGGFVDQQGKLFFNRPNRKIRVLYLLMEFKSALKTKGILLLLGSGILLTACTTDDVATSKQPEVALSSRCTNSRGVRLGLTQRSASIQPRLMRLPPCTAMPAGLSISINEPSSYTMRCSSQSSSPTFGSLLAVSGRATGGILTRSPSLSR